MPIHSTGGGAFSRFAIPSSLAILTAGVFALCACSTMPGREAAAEPEAWLAPSPKLYSSAGTATLRPSFSFARACESTGLSTDELAVMKEFLGGKFGWKDAGDAKAGCVISFVKETPSENPEAYGLEMCDGGIVISAGSKEGFLRAFGRLRAVLDSPLAKAMPDGSVECPAMKLRDWPDIPLRGMHLQMAFQVREELARRTIDAMSKLGFNFVVLEVGGRFESLKHPECCRRPWWTQAQLRSLVKYAKSRGVTPIPGIDSLGHLERAPQVCIAGNAAMNITDPKFYGTYFDLLDELSDVFDNPPYFQIGTDEFELTGAAALLEKLTGKSGHEYYSEFLNAANAHLKGKGIKTVIWNDMLLDPASVNKGEPANGRRTFKAIDTISKDIVIDYWCYENLDDYKGLTLIAGKGFETWASPWFGAKAISSLCRQAYALKAKAVLGTTWDCGFVATDAFVQTAECSWNASSLDAGLNPPYDVWSVVNLLYYGRDSKACVSGAAQMEVSGLMAPSAKFMDSLKAVFPEGLIEVSGLPVKLDSPRSFLFAPPVIVSGKEELAKLEDWRSGRILIYSPSAAGCVSVDGVDKSRGAEQVIVYTPKYGRTTRTNQHGVEWIVRDGKVTGMDRAGSCEIPQDGYVVSAHSGSSNKRITLAGICESGDVRLVLCPPPPKSVDPVVMAPSGKAAGLAVLMTSEYPLDGRAVAGKIEVELSDGSRESFEIKGSFQKWSYGLEASGNWRVWTAWQGVGLERIVAFEWRRPANAPAPKKVVVSPSPSGVDSGLVVFGGVQF